MIRFFTRPISVKQGSSSSDDEPTQHVADIVDVIEEQGTEAKVFWAMRQIVAALIPDKADVQVHVWWRGQKDHFRKFCEELEFFPVCSAWGAWRESPPASP